MGLCVFKTAKIKRCIEHALKSKYWNMAWSDEPAQPGFLFVHDQGVYLMSNGNPRDLVAGTDSSYCTYAQDCNPAIDAEWWENARALVGGDDFGEFIPMPKNWKSALEKYEAFCIDVRENKLEIYFQETADAK